jgi:hypothetical protein
MMALRTMTKLADAGGEKLFGGLSGGSELLMMASVTQAAAAEKCQPSACIGMT